MLRTFAKWFGSAAGVWQTFFIVTGCVIGEYLHLIHDNNMFQLMAWLTIYSAVTQPVLAYVNRRDTSHSEDVLSRIEQFERKQAETEEKLLQELKKSQHCTCCQ